MAYEQGYVGDPRGRETAVEDAESYGGGLSLEMGVGPEDEPDQVASVPTPRDNIGFYLDEDYDLPAEEGILPDVVDQTGETQRNQALFDLFTLGQLSGQTPYGQFQVNPRQKPFGFLFNEQPAPYLGPNARFSPFVGINPRGGMIGVRGDF